MQALDRHTPFPDAAALRRAVLREPTSLDGLIEVRTREIVSLDARIAHLREELQDLVCQRWAIQRTPKPKAAA